jgi:hypothetical protein
MMPIDPSSRGTWIGANDAGLVACLLNSNPPRRPSAPAPRNGLSRGAIVPLVLSAASLEGALVQASIIDAERYPPFRLLVLSGGWCFVAHSDGRSTTASQPAPLKSPLLLSSSGLGDHLVESIRGAIFEGTLAGAPDPLRAQARFHAHRWPDRPHLSVLMSRRDARTVSQTVVDIRPDLIELYHIRLDDDLEGVGVPSRVSLATRRIEAAA